MVAAVFPVSPHMVCLNDSNNCVALHCTFSSFLCKKILHYCILALKVVHNLDNMHI